MKTFFVFALGALGACSSSRNLTVKSTPAEAEVCIKGKAGSELFSSKEKSCIGSTPLEIDRAEVIGSDGKKHTVKFNGLDEKESFYLVVSRKGFASESVLVPGWDHFVSLRQEGDVEEVVKQNEAKLRIFSEPAGALVFVNDVLKGNTPYTVVGYEKSMRIKLEQPGYETFDRVLKVEPGEIQEIVLTLQKVKEDQRLLSSVKE